MVQIDIENFDISQLHNVGTVNTLINNLNNIRDQLKRQLEGVTLFYRGHADKMWNLTPGIYRSQNSILKEDYLVHNLIRHCPIVFQNCVSSFDKLVKMQHYELPTRLLDITMNPLVALYFAACGEPNKDGSINLFFVKNSDIYNFDDNWVNIISRLSFLKKEIIDVKDDRRKWQNLINILRSVQEPIPYMTNASDLDKVLCVLPKLDNPRIIRQQGAFFLFGIANGEKSNMANLEVSSIRMTIPAQRKPVVLSQLDQLGVNEKFCFPEIDKVAHYLKANL